MGKASALLAIDLGTSRCRAALFSPEGTVLAQASRPTPIETPAPDQVVLDLHVLWRDIRTIVRELDPGHHAISGVGVTAQLGMVAIDADRNPLGPALLWSDRRATGEAEALRETCERESLAIATRRITAELTAPRLKWLARHQPDIHRRIDSVVSLKDFVLLRLTGALVTDETHASYTGLFDVDRREWSGALCCLQDVSPTVLPAVRPATAVAGNLTNQAAEAIDLEAGTPFAVGASDGTIGCVGAGAVRPGVTIDVAGTTDVLLHVSATPIRDEKGAAIVNAHAAPGLWTVGGPTGMTGGAVAWIARILGYSSVAEAERTLGVPLAAIPPGADRLAMQPALAGSRFPDWNSAGRGAIVGLSTEHEPASLLRAAQEGAAFTVRRALSVLQRCGLTIDEVTVVGGLADQSAALQLRADILATRIRTLANREASTVGAAMVAGVAGGVFTDLGQAAEKMVRYDRTILPEAGRAAAYDRAYGVWSRAFYADSA